MQMSTTYFFLFGLSQQFCIGHAGEMAVGITGSDKAVAESTQPLEVLQLKHLYFVICVWRDLA